MARRPSPTTPPSTWPAVAVLAMMTVVGAVPAQTEFTTSSKLLLPVGFPSTTSTAASSPVYAITTAAQVARTPKASPADMPSSGSIASSNSPTGAPVAAAGGSDSPTTASSGALHVGRLTRADEPAAIDRLYSGLENTTATDVRTGWRIEPPTGWYESGDGGTLVWHEPATGETAFLSVVVQDAADLRSIPGCRVSASLYDAAGKEVVSTTTLPVLWDPAVYVYGINVALPTVLAPLAGLGTSSVGTTVTLALRVEAPTFRRRDQAVGAFFTQAINRIIPGVTVPPTPVVSARDAAKPAARGIFASGRRPYAQPTPYPGAAAASDK